MEDMHSVVSRSKRRKQNKKQNGPSKKLIIILSLLGCFLLAGGLYTYYKVYHEKELDAKAYKESEKLLLEKIQTTQKQEGPASQASTKFDGKLETLLYTPTEQPTNEPLQKMTSTLESLLKKAVANCSSTSPTKIVARIKSSNFSSLLTAFQPLIDSYTWNEAQHEWEQKTITDDQTIFINQQTHQPLQLKDLIPSNADMAAIQQVVKQKILEESTDAANILDAVLAMPKMTLENTTFSYAPTKISLSLPANSFNKTEITLDYATIAGHVNPDFIDKDSIKDAQTAPLEPNKKYISLTFDDGPNPATTPKLLDILKEKQVSATFFMLGQNVAANTDLVKRVNDEGHEIASHSYSHPQLTICSPEKVTEEVNKTDKAIYQAIGKLPVDFRPPYGAVNTAAAEIIGKPIIEWSVDSQDWKSRNTQAIIQRVKATAYNDSIVLMHDIHPETVAAVPTIIDQLRADGYEIIPVRQLLGNKAKPMHMYYGSTDERPVQ